jgi:hypothetical protein
MDLAHVPRRHALRAHDAFCADHPLARASDEAAAADRRLLLAVAFTTAGTALLALTRRDLATAFLLAGSAVSGVTGIAALALRQSVATVAIAVIAAGNDQHGVRELDRARARLYDPRVRAGLAHSLGLYAGATPASGIRLSLLPAFVAAPEACEALRALADELLREPAPPPRVIALCACLLTDGQTSPLFHHDPVQLGHELRRIRYLAEAADGAYPDPAAAAFGSAPNR